MVYKENIFIMSQKKIRIGIVGSRFAAGFHLSSLRRLSGIGAEVYSKTRESRGQFAGKHVNPIDANVLYNPVEKQLDRVYLNEKLGTKQGWSFPAPDENRTNGYLQEMQDFIECLIHDREPQSNL